MDPRDISLPPSDLSILAGVRDENQRTILKQAMESNAWKVSELAARADQLEKENAGLKGVAAEGKRAIAEAGKLKEQLKSAEGARRAAERVAEKERFARIGAEGYYQDLVEALQDANKKESRLEKLLSEHDV